MWHHQLTCVVPSEVAPTIIVSLYFKMVGSKIDTKAHTLAKTHINSAAYLKSFVIVMKWPTQKKWKVVKKILEINRDGSLLSSNDLQTASFK